jgi:hypothetical protein
MNDDTMTVNDEQPRLHAALRKVADSFEAPDLDALCEQAVRRGRRTLVRRRALGAGIGVVALAGVAIGAVGVVAGAHRAPGIGRTVPVVTVSSGDLAEYMAKNLVALLPKDVTLDEGDGAVPLTGAGISMGPSNGEWEASATVLATYQGKATTFQFAVVQQELDRSCITQLSASVYTCTSTPLDGHPLLSEETLQNGAPVNWTYTWNVGGSKAIELSVDRELPESLVARVVTAPAWTGVLRELPAYVDCPTLERTRVGKIPVWKCPTTGKTYPTEPSDMYLYPSS